MGLYSLWIEVIYDMFKLFHTFLLLAKHLVVGRTASLHMIELWNICWFLQARPQNSGVTFIISNIICNFQNTYWLLRLRWVTWTIMLIYLSPIFYQLVGCFPDINIIEFVLIYLVDWMEIPGLQAGGTLVACLPGRPLDCPPQFVDYPWGSRVAQPLTLFHHYELGLTFSYHVSQDWDLFSIANWTHRI